MLKIIWIKLMISMVRESALLFPRISFTYENGYKLPKFKRFRKSTGLQNYGSSIPIVNQKGNRHMPNLLTDLLHKTRKLFSW
jgi:2-hydroxychromene-2-carboxylate isomerase